MSRSRLGRDQTGIVSFFVVMIIMIVLTLIVLAFAQLVRREQRQTLDRQLKTQALYAAESGVNDAIDWISDPANLPAFLAQDWDECDGPGSFIEDALGGGSINILDGPGGVISYSCLLVDPAPADLTYTVPTSSSAMFRLQPQDSLAAIRSLRISWTDDLGGSTVTDCPTSGPHSFTGNGSENNPASDCEFGTLRLEILPFNGPASRNALIDSRYIAFVQPRNGGTTEANFANGTDRAQGQVEFTGCTAGTCTVEIVNISPAITQGYMRIGSIYRASEVTVNAFSVVNPGPSDTPLATTGAQVEIDATGKANDVLHRIKVNVSVPLSGDGPAPEYVLQSRLTQCKRFELPFNPPGGIVWFSSDPDYARCDPLQPTTSN